MGNSSGGMSASYDVSYASQGARASVGDRSSTGISVGGGDYDYWGYGNPYRTNESSTARAEVGGRSITVETSSARDTSTVARAEVGNRNTDNGTPAMTDTLARADVAARGSVPVIDVGHPSPEPKPFEDTFAAEFKANCDAWDKAHPGQIDRSQDVQVANIWGGFCPPDLIPHPHPPHMPEPQPGDDFV